MTAREGHLLEDMQRTLIEQQLRRFSGRRAPTAAALGIGIRTLGNKLRQWRDMGQPFELYVNGKPLAAPVPASPSRSSPPPTMPVWIVTDGVLMKCRRCGVARPVHVTCSIEDLCRQGEAFAASHGDCEAKA